jgi:palmitoyltransferase
MFACCGDKSTCMARYFGYTLFVILMGLIGIITWSAISAVALFYIHKGQTAVAIVFLVFYFIFLLNLLFNYFCAAFTSPGYMDDYKEIALQQAQESLVGEEQMKTCEKCQAPKLHRVHHCSMCTKCVVHMDHHCPWVMNCVGYKNTRYFLLFLFYTFWASLVMACFALPIAFIDPQFQDGGKPLLIIGACVSAAAAIAMAFFIIWSWGLVIKDLSVIDLMQQKNIESRPVTCARMKTSFQRVFGTENFFLVILPSFRKLSDNPWEHKFIAGEGNL